LRASLAAAGIACGEARYGPAGRLELRAAQAGCSPTKVMKRSTQPSAPKAKTS